MFNYKKNWNCSKWLSTWKHYKSNVALTCKSYFYCKPALTAFHFQPWMDTSEAPTTAHFHRLNIASPSQTEWCHHWTDELHNNCPPMWLLCQATWSIRTNQLRGSMRLHTSVLQCARVCVYIPVVQHSLVCPRLHLLIQAPLLSLPDSLRVSIFHT